MTRIAVLLTVFNRREVTLQGLRTLYKSIDYLGGDYAFDIYMTDDGCSDGTSEAVKKEFSDIHIIKGDGNLYWSGGMCKAWQAAIDSKVDYDFYLWFNDDANLYNDALVTMFNSYELAGTNAIISGAFCDEDGQVSYGGRDRHEHLIIPDGNVSPIFLLNGNLVLISCLIYNKLGTIDNYFKHGYGDWDYGLRAIESKLEVLLSTKYVGVTKRHDSDLVKYASAQYSLKARLIILYHPKNSPRIEFEFKRRHFGVISAIIRFLVLHVYTFFPVIFKYRMKLFPT